MFLILPKYVTIKKPIGRIYDIWWDYNMISQDEMDFKAFLSGDIQGFESMVLRYKNPLIYFIERYVKNLDTAEDLAQDVFVELFVHKDRYRFKSGLKTYIFAIGRNKAIDYIRKEEKNCSLEILNEQEDFINLEELVIKKEEIRRLSQAIERLREDYKEIILLIDFEELSYKETAKVLNKTLPQVKILVHRARKSLREIMERKGRDEK